MNYLAISKNLGQVVREIRTLNMPFRSYDTLRVFTVVARYESVTAAAQELNLSKASVSYQIRKLED